MGKNEPPRLTLQVPEPPARPGDKPDFSYLKLAPAGSVDRPPVHASAAQMHDYAYSLVRVLDDAGNAVGPWAPQVDAELLRTGLRAMMKTRVFDAHGSAGVRFTMTEPWTALLLDDARVIHETTPIQSDGANPVRDTLVVTYREHGFQAPA